MGTTLRPINPEADYPRVAELLSDFESEPVTVDILNDRERRWPTNGVRQRRVAVGLGGGLIGYSVVERRPTDTLGLYHVRVIVDHPCRGAGVGTALFDDALVFANQHEATRLKGKLRDDDPASLRFAEQHGFRVLNQQFESVLDLATFDPSRFSGTVESVERSGIRFFSYADTARSKADRWKLWELNVLNAQDVPGTEPDIAERWPFEQFEKDVFESFWFLPEGQILAADGDRWVGLAAVGEFRPGVLVNAHTGVLRDYRGRGIATALKLLAIELARGRGAQYLRTNNHSTNGAILAVNRKLGYQPEPGWYEVARDLS